MRARAWTPLVRAAHEWPEAAPTLQHRVETAEPTGPMQRAVLAAILSVSPTLVGCAPSPWPQGEGSGSGSAGWPIELEPGDESSSDDGDEPGIGAQGGGGGEASSSSGDPEDGCVITDLPDIVGFDNDLDGVDGTMCALVFVDPTSVAGGTGLTPSDPLSSLADAIELAASFEPARDVLVVRGSIAESIELRGDVDIYGGYEHDFVTRNLAFPTVLVGDGGPHTIHAQALDAPVTVQNFVVIGRDGESPGMSGYAVAILDSVGATVAFDRCTIVAGDGMDGADGADGAHGASGLDGAHGDEGGAGGASTCARGGGDGAGATMCPLVAAIAGAGPGEGDAGISAEPDCTGTVCTDVPDAGGHGGDGSDGVHGSGAEAYDGLGKLDDLGKWIMPAPSDASGGSSGGGGGGGGAASIDLDGPSCGLVHFSDGGVGGGGGGAGCGGGAGESGGMGGSSIAIAVVDADIDLRMTTIVRGLAGDGGDGGDGGNAGHGGAGGSGRMGQGFSPALAGDGGRGGDGGVGGGGAGGCAGSSIAIAHRGLGVLTTQQLTIEGGDVGMPGTGGKGGVAVGQTAVQISDRMGEPGCPGILIETLKQ